jgi:hypothetical protein
MIEPDMYVEAEGWVVEAKKSSARGYVRMAIGQVLDYTHNAQSVADSVTPMILLPGQPDRDLRALAADLRISVATRDADSFEITAP